MVVSRTFLTNHARVLLCVAAARTDQPGTHYLGTYWPCWPPRVRPGP